VSGEPSRTPWVAVGAGLIFAVGLGLSGMTQPIKVLGFLDVAGDWDPALLFVMVGAIAVHMPFALPRARSSSPSQAPVDRRLLLGAAMFGVGWGASGYCPGPALVSLLSFSPQTLLFVAAMVVGMKLRALLRSRAPGRASTLSQASKKTTCDA
jgi:uncharacterized membrane protein YedE/YeeE